MDWFERLMGFPESTGPAGYEKTRQRLQVDGRHLRFLLTALGGGAFGNDETWIRAAMGRALKAVEGRGLDVVFVSYGRPSPGWQRWVAEQA
jgi:hypothetical protein